MAQVGVSLIYDAVREELCFAEMSQLAIGFQERGERQKLLVRIADIQIDNQMEQARKPVLLANRGGGGQGAEEVTTKTTCTFTGNRRVLYVHLVIRLSFEFLRRATGWID